MILAILFAAAMAVPGPSMDDCAGCHEDQARAFAAGPHGVLMARRGMLQQACATCHEGAAAHVENPSKETIRRVPRDAACATCHRDATKELLLGSPGHQRQRVACLDCHASGHGTAAGHLLAAEPQRVCATCHRTEAARFALPFAHRDGQQAMACTECHSPHAARRPARLRMIERGGACLECHTDLAGPHVYEHPPREANGCLACHDPHGSANPRLLTRATIASLCLECHTNVPHDVSASRFRVCTSCHTAVHGSNRDRRLFDR